MARDLTDERAFFLSTLPAGPRDRWLAAATVGVSAAIFLAALPFAKVPLAPVAAFIPIYQSAQVINDLITAGLLFGQFSILRIARTAGAGRRVTSSPPSSPSRIR